MLRQYHELTTRYPDHLLLFRLGDFYEAFFEDAELAARLLQITVTARQGAPMAGIPHHAADGYIARLVHAGQKIAVCEQLEAPGPTKKLLRRGVVRIITPGTLTDTAYLEGDALGHLTRLMRLTPADAMVLDETAVVTLELLESSRGSVRDSLFAVLDETVTPMGARLLRQWLLRPLLDPGAIAARQAAVGALVEAPAERASLSALLRRIGDIERLTSRATLGQAHGRDLVGLRACLAPLPEIRRVAAAISAEPIEEALAELAPLGDLRDFLAAALEDEPPLGLHDGGLIRESWHEGLAAIVRDAREARAWIAGLEERERVRTGIPSLRVRFNRVFGYGIEVTHAHAARVPAEYVRRQTLTGAERYVTPELKEYEAKALGADERCRRLEYQLFEDVRRRVAARAEELLVTARARGRPDVFASLAEVAHTRGHVRPIVEESDALTIVEGRHPVLESRAGSPVTPNDLALDRDARIVILTGPNMSGKSVYLRQTAHLAIMAA